MPYKENSKYFVVLSLFVGISFACTEKLNVTVYYEVLCPDSINFITQQLYPSYVKIGDSLSVQYVPFGKATMKKGSNGQWKFSCQHGPLECRGNKIQACALKVAKGPLNQLHFINCMESSGNPASLIRAKKCSALVDICWSCLKDCATSRAGDDLLAKMGSLTAKLNNNLRFVPTIVFNEVYKQKLEDDAIKDFLNTACSLFRVTPSGCT